MDKRQIEVIEEYKKGLDLVQQMNPVTYQVRGLKARQLGLVAQDLQTLEPTTVTKTNQGTLAIDYEQLIVVLINAVKELKAEVDDIKSKKLKK